MHTLQDKQRRYVRKRIFIDSEVKGTYCDSTVMVVTQVISLVTVVRDPFVFKLLLQTSLTIVERMLLPQIVETRVSLKILRTRFY